MSLLSRTAPSGNTTIGDNLKNYRTPGMYSVASQYVFSDSGDSNTIYGTLITFAGAYDSFVTQLLFTNGNEMYYRQYIEGVWSDWNKA